MQDNSSTKPNNEDDEFDPIEDFSPDDPLCDRPEFSHVQPADNGQEPEDPESEGPEYKDPEDESANVNAPQTTTHPPPPPQLCSSPQQPLSPDTSTYPPTWVDGDRGSLHSAYSVAQRIKRRAMREQREREEEKEMERRKKRAGSSNVKINVETGVKDLVDEMMCVEAEAEADGNDMQHPELVQENHPTCQERPVPSPNRQNDPSPTTQRPPGISTSFLSSPRPSTWHPGDMTGPLTTTTGRFPIRQHVARPSSSSSAESPSQFAVRTDLGLKPQRMDQQVQNLDAEDEDLLSLCSSSSSSIFSLAPSPPPRSSLHDQRQQQRRGPSIPANIARSQPPSHTFRAPMPPRAPSPSVNSRASTPVNWAVGDVRERLRGLEKGQEKELRGDVGEEVQRRRVRFVGENEIEGGYGEVPVVGVVNSRLEESGEGAEGGYAGDEEFEDGMSEKVIMAINYAHRRLGCAYYNSTTERLCLMEDMAEAPPFDLVKMLKFQICPTTILTSARADEAFLTLLKANEMGLPRPPPVDLHSSTAFAHTSGRTRLLSTQIRTMTQGSRWNDANKKDVYLYLAGFVDMESQVTVGCVGALIGYLNRIRAEGLLPETSEDEDRPLEVLGVEPFSLSTIMHINADTLSSLQIFEDESHPNMHQSRGKEGLSLFGILNNTRTTLGASLLKQWFLRPVLDFVLLDHRHRTIECLLLPENLHVAEQVGSCLRNVKNVPRILESMRGRVGVTEWQKILQFAYYCLRIRNLVRELTNCDVPVMNRIKETFVVNDLKDVGSFINDVIDFDESVTENRFVVKQHVDEELDELKRVYVGLDEFLFQIAQEISTTIPSNFASTLNVIYFPQLGYLITVPLRSEWKKEEDFQIEGLYYQFSTATTVYYKNDRMRQLDETLGDIHGLIVDKEIEIMQMLSERVLEYAPLLICTAEVCAELDCLLSLADAARKYNYCRPTMANENVLKIVRGRHPLQELCVDVFIPNDTYLIGGRGVTRHQGLAENDDDREPGESDSRLTSSSSERNSNHAECGDRARESGGVNSAILLSGANYSGKSVYLKQVALITYMAHIGSFVPAESATIGLTDKIFTRVQTRETISKIESAFMIDLQQVSVALRNATKRSLVIIDEFGKGTGSTDGAGLFCAVLEYFLYRGEDCPKLVAATHFHELFQDDILSPSLPITLCTMEIVREDRASRSESGSDAGEIESRDSRTVMTEDLTFLYRLVQGRSSGASWGTWCAAMAGVPEDVVLRAIYFSDLFSRHESVPEQLTNEERLKYAQCERVARRFLQLDLDEQSDMGEVTEFFNWLGKMDDDDDSNVSG